MFTRLNNILSGLPATVIGGIFLLLSFILPRVGLPAGEHFAWICVFICGIPLLYLSVWRIIHNKGIAKISSALLITIAMFAAIAIGDLFAAGEVAFIMEIGAILEDMVTERAKKGLKNLISLTPVTGRVLRNGPDGAEEIIPADRIRKGDLLRILPGEAVPVDGIIRAGETSIDQSVMTGESLPVDKVPGDEVWCGTVNCFGSIDIEATRVGEDSSLQKLIRLISDAEKKQAPAQRIADRWASVLVPVALMIAIAAWLVTGDIVRAVTVLVVFCPCALVLATPTAIMAAIGQASKRGVIIKSGEALEKMGSIRTIAFDKTGTITRGKLTVTDVIPFTSPDRTAETAADSSETPQPAADPAKPDPDADELLALCAAAESRSEHPLGKAVTAFAKEKSLPLPACTSFQMSAGKGISAEVDGHKLLLGSEKYLEECGISARNKNADSNAKSNGEPAGNNQGGRQPAAILAELRRQGKAAVLAAENGRLLGVIALSDTIRPEAKDVIRELASMGTDVVLLTGDHPEAAAWFASQAGIAKVKASLLPKDKVSEIGRLSAAGGVCMIGDGVNDAPALKLADVGAAMGAMGSDIAVEAADVALMTDDLSNVPYLKWLGRTTVRTIRGAITLSMCINFAAIILSVLGVLTPTTGALVHNCGSCFVVLLAALLYDRPYPGGSCSDLKKSQNRQSLLRQKIAAD